MNIDKTPRFATGQLAGDRSKSEPDHKPPPGKPKPKPVKEPPGRPGRDVPEPPPIDDPQPPKPKKKVLSCHSKLQQLL